MATFESIQAEIPINIKTASGQGFLPLLMRTFLHVIWAASISKESKSTKKNALILVELEEALKHYKSAVLPEVLSKQTSENLINLGRLLEAARDGLNAWTDDQFMANMQSLNSVVLQIAANTDRELLGIKSDAGRTL